MLSGVIIAPKYSIPHNSVRPSKVKVEAMKYLLITNNVKVIQGFLELTGCFIKFISGYSITVKLYMQDVTFAQNRKQLPSTSIINFFNIFF